MIYHVKILPKHTSQVQEIEKKSGKTTRPESDGNKTDKIPCKDLIFVVTAFEGIFRTTTSNECCFFVAASLSPVNDTTIHENWSKENTTNATAVVDSKCV